MTVESPFETCPEPWYRGADPGPINWNLGGGFRPRPDSWEALLKDMERAEILIVDGRIPGWIMPEAFGPYPELAKVVAMKRFGAIATLYRRLAQGVYGIDPFPRELFADCETDPYVVAWRIARDQGEEAAIGWANAKIVYTLL